MDELPRNHGRSYLLLSDEDRRVVLQQKWRIYGKYGYVLELSIGTGKPQPLSRFIAERMGLDTKNKKVELINGDIHDVRRGNIRVAPKVRRVTEDITSSIRLDTDVLDWLRRRPGGIEANLRKAVEEYKAKFSEV